ncbi:hypothetical protein DL96DRAFT_711862 [Flagelloscypha sp. PMI_526]|nr:hypothetical protein DL96DRAFT_711862 [Flagelloscypha sp. PMI_526]
MFSLYRLLPLFLIPLVGAAPRNQTVPITDTSGIATKSGGGWSAGSAFSCGQYTQVVGDSITFRFTGTAFWVMGSPPDPQAITATLDGATVQTSAGAICTTTVVSSVGLSQAEHTLTLTYKGPLRIGNTNEYLVVGDFIYTTDDAVTSTTSASSAASTPSSASKPPDTTNSPANAAASPASHSNKKPGAIAGGVIGGLVAAILAVLAVLNAKHLLYLLASLAFLVFGWWMFGRRRLNFYTDKDVGQIQITLFLSPHEILKDSEDGAKETLVAWQVFDIGHSRRDFNVICPCVLHTGDTKFGFGTVVAEKEWISAETYAPAPAIWTGEQWEDHNDTALIHPVATNKGETMDVALGTFEDGKDEHIFKPFLVVKDVEQENSYTFEEGKNLYLHVFLTNNYREGKRARDLVSKFNDDKLTKKGIKLVDLKPISQWHIKKEKGKIVLAGIRGAKNDSNA